MPEAPTHAELKAKQRAVRAGFPEPMGLRVHRAISWVGRAEAEGGDDDARFVFLWIAFNAAYTDEERMRHMGPGERAAFGDYFDRVVRLDPGGRIYRALWQRFSGPVRLLMQSPYVFHPFWQHQNGIPGHEDWQGRFRASAYAFKSAFETQDTARVLSFVFDRLYVLRNQIVHGGATWNGSVNRDQVRNGAAILAFSMPVFLDIMMDHPDEEWGQPFYPVVA